MSHNPLGDTPARKESTRAEQVADCWLGARAIGMHTQRGDGTSCIISERIGDIGKTRYWSEAWVYAGPMVARRTAEFVSDSQDSAHLAGESGAPTYIQCF
jgi:hypothetical protein